MRGVVTNYDMNKIRMIRMELVTEMIMWKGDSCQIMGKAAILCLTGLKAESPAEFTPWLSLHQL